MIQFDFNSKIVRDFDSSFRDGMKTARRSHQCLRGVRALVVRSLICLILLSVGLINAATSYAWQSDDEGRLGAQLFDHAIDLAQQRTVKITGATVGNVKGYGTGILVDNEGTILASAGVYLTGNRVRVTMNDGSIYDASVIRTDRDTNLALLKIDAETPEYFALRTEPVGQPGDWAITFSNAFKVATGDEPMSVNLGIISLRTSIEAYQNQRDLAYRGPLVLIDAITSNPGAAGGAVVTVDGELIGMIGKVIESNDTNTRLNYAIPSDFLVAFVENRLGELVASTTGTDDAADAKPAELGIRLFGLNGPRSPAYVDRVMPGSPARDAQIRPDDLIISLAGEKINSIRDFQRVMETLVPGTQVVIVISRREELMRLEITPVEKE